MACKVKTKRHGYLAFRFYWNGREFWQGTGWTDTAKNRTKAEGKALEITEEIDAGTFNYLKWFPKGNKAHEFLPKQEAPAVNVKAQTVGQFYEEWIEKKKPPFIRLGLERNYKQDFKRYILPFMADTELTSMTVDILGSFRIHLVGERRLAVKTARNIIDGSLRAMFRDAGRRVDRNPFNEIPANWWPRLPQREPDPYTERERDAILAYYRANRPPWGSCLRLFPLLDRNKTK
jgi:Arm DNA-binding domain